MRAFFLTIKTVCLKYTIAPLIWAMHVASLSLKGRLHMIGCVHTSARWSWLGRFLMLILALVFGSLLPAAEPPEDAESFLPNAVALQGATLTVGSVAYSPDGKHLAMGAGWIDQPFGELRLWDVGKGRMIATVQAAKGLRSVAFSPDGKHLASGELDGTVPLRDPTNGEVRATLRGHTIGVNSVAFSADSKALAAAGLDNFVTVWNVAERKQRL